MSRKEPQVDLFHAAPPKSIAAPKKKVERSAPAKPRQPAPAATLAFSAAGDGVALGSSLDMPLIQNTMLGAHDATVSVTLTLHPITHAIVADSIAGHELAAQCHGKYSSFPVAGP